jgi:NADH:ubiquinone oxidoreductase subunit C
MQDIIGRLKETFFDKILKIQERSLRRIYLEIRPEDIVSFAKFIFKDLGCRFCIASGTDTPEGLEILYHFSDDSTGRILSLRVLLKDKKHPQIDSLALVFKGAEWIEREIWEMLGINFLGHPNLKRLLLADAWPEGEYPLRKRNNKNVA